MLCFILCLFFTMLTVTKQYDIYVFIHGSVLSGATFLDLERLLKDTWPEDASSWSEQTIDAYRAEKSAYHSDCMLDYGLIPLDPQHIQGTIPQELQQYAAYHIVRAFARFNAFTHTASTSHAEVEYDLYGWPGLLSRTKRDEIEAQKLYTHLRERDIAIKRAGDTVRWLIYSHSHGAQLVLNLPRIRSDHPEDKDFVIDTVVLSAAPLYYANARHILRGMFHTVINVYSRADIIQIADIFSTPTRSPARTLGEVVPMPLHHAMVVVDVELTVCDTALFGHGSFFILNRYSGTSLIMPRARRKACHALLQQLNPIPLVSFYPLILQPLMQFEPGYYAIRANAYTIQNQHEDRTVHIDLHHNTTTSTCATASFPITISAPNTVLDTIRREIQEVYHKTGYRSEIHKAMSTMKHMILTIFRTKSL